MGDELFGRDDELRRLGALVRDARNGIGGAVVVRGEPGIGKSALLDAAVVAARDARVARVDGYEAESSIAYAALHRLVGPWSRRLEALPPRTRDAVRTVLGHDAGPAPDRFLVGLGVLELLVEVGRDEPVLCVVDDLHWLDAESAGVLAFVARRLVAEPVALVLACRDDERSRAVTVGVPELRLAGLDEDAAGRLLVSQAQGTVDPLVVARVVRATGGNPLALIDLAHRFTARELHDSAVGEEPVPVGRHLEAHYLERVRDADPGVRTWLLVAGADGAGNLALVDRACAELSLDPRHAETAEDLGLVELGVTARFRHPLVRAAAYGAASARERRRVHAALSTAAQAAGSAELAAWHASKAAVGLDAEVAARLDAVADAAGARGGFVSRARVLGRAAELTPPGPLRDRRLVAAAGAAQVGGTLLDDLDPDRLEPAVRARAVAVRVSQGIFTGDPAVVTRACADMLGAAALLHGVDPAAEQEALVRAFGHAVMSDRLLRGTTLPELGRRLSAGAGAAPGPTAVVLRALGALVLLEHEDAVPALRDGVAALAELDGPRLLGFATAGVALTTALWDLRGRDAWLERVTGTARDLGSLQTMDTSLWMSSLAELTGGTPRRAGEYLEQVRELRRAIGYDGEHVVNVAYLAWTGAPRELVVQGAAATSAVGFGGVEASAVGALAVRDLAEGHYRDAYGLLAPLVDDPYLQLTPLQVPDLVEAAVRAGHPEDAERHTARLEVAARANGSPWALGVALRCRALLSEPSEAERLFAGSARALDDAGAPVEAARSRLLHGELLRRRRRRADARLLLQAARSAFDDAGATAFARRARAELAATGEPVVDGGPGTGSVLTTREDTVARLAAQGRTNAEIGASLFISANTVDYHLRKVFQKLGVTSRRQLRERLGDARPHDGP